MTILTVVMLSAAVLLSLELTKVAIAAARTKPAVVAARPRRRIGRIATFLVALALPVLGAAFGYYPT